MKTAKKPRTKYILRVCIIISPLLTATIFPLIKDKIKRDVMYAIRG